MLTYFFHGNETIQKIPNYFAVYSHCHTTFNYEILESLKRMNGAFFFIIYDNDLKNTGKLYQVFPYDSLELAKEDNKAEYIIAGEKLLDERPS